eukprot:16277179-Heterocapsa_arctica.AAC.1
MPTEGKWGTQRYSRQCSDSTRSTGRREKETHTPTHTHTPTQTHTNPHGHAAGSGKENKPPTHGTYAEAVPTNFPGKRE